MVFSIAAALIAARLTAVHVALRVILLVSRGRGAEGIKREHGADYPSGANAVAAPATVSGQSPSLPTDLTVGKGTETTKRPRARRPASEPGWKPMQLHTEGVSQ
jgi:hypothetical protein